MPPVSNSLSTDLYELNMVQAYLDRGENKEAVFEFFVRRLPARRGFLLAAGLADALDSLESLRFSNADIGSTVRIGAPSDTGDGAINFNGLLDNVQVYNVALSAQQVAGSILSVIAGGDGLPDLPHGEPI